MSLELTPEWLLRNRQGSGVSLSQLLRLLSAIHGQGSIGKAAAKIGISYRHAWGMLRDFEAEFSIPLLEKSRGRGTTLTQVAIQLIWADRRIIARISPILESFASELEAALSSASSALRITASHGFAVEKLINRLSAEQVPVEINYRSRQEAVMALARGECDLAGFHVPVGEFRHANQSCLRWLDPDEHALIHLAYRVQGLFVPKSNPKNIQGLHDLLRRDVRFINRQTGSGTRMLLELLLDKSGLRAQDIADYDNAEFTHSAIAAYVASGMADVGFGVETAARRFDLDFIPMARENYFFACKAESLEFDMIKTAREILQDASFRDEVCSLPGYEGSSAGSMVRFEDIFLSMAPA